MITEKTTKDGDISLELPRIIAKLWTLSQLIMFVDKDACGFGDSDKDLFGVACIIEDISDELEMMEKVLYPPATKKQIKEGLERIRGGGCEQA
jgi:hypothetical protein